LKIDDMDYTPGLPQSVISLHKLPDSTPVVPLAFLTVAYGRRAHRQKFLTTCMEGRIHAQSVAQFLQSCDSARGRYWERDGAQSENSTRRHTMKTSGCCCQSLSWSAIDERPSCFRACCYRQERDTRFL